MKIQVKSTDVETLRGIGRSGKPYEIRKQSAFLLRGEEIRRVELPLSREQPPYAPGFYARDERSFEVDHFANLKIGRVILTTVDATVRIAAS